MARMTASTAINASLRVLTTRSTTWTKCALFINLSILLELPFLIDPEATDVDSCRDTTRHKFRESGDSRSPGLARVSWRPARFCNPRRPWSFLRALVQGSCPDQFFRRAYGCGNDVRRR